MNFSLPEMTSDAEMKFPFADKLQLSKRPSGACRSGVGQIQLSMLHLLPAVPAGSPSRGGDVAVDVFDKKQPSLTTPFYSVLVSVFVFMALSTLFHSINSPDNSSLFSLCSSGLNSVLLVLSTIYLFMKVSLSPDVILCG